MPKAPAPPPAPRPAPSPSLPAGPEHYHFSPTGELLPRASLLDTQALSQEAPTSLLRGLTNLFLVCVFWLVAGEVCGEACTTSGGPPTATAYLGRFLSHSLALPLLAEGLAALLAISALWLLAAYCAVGCAFPYASAASTAAQAIGVSALLLGVPLWVRCCTPTWPFLQRLALCMAAGVQALKLWSLCETNRALQREVLGGQGAGEGECVEAVLAHAQPPAPPAFAGPLPDGAQWALARHPWPQRATLGTFASHLLSPNIVFVPNLPRRSHIRLAYISEKLVLGLLLTLVATHVHEGFLVPLWAGAARIHSPAHFFRSFLATVNPIAFVTGCLFLIVFECITNICSEFLCIADRPFYGDWWTSTSFEHFSRQWNKPISDFLRRHLYAPLKRQGSRTALLVTMAFSIAMHEVFLCAAMGGTWRLPWLAIFSVFQLPLIPLLRLLPPTAASNLFFWAGLSTGLGCIALLYARDYSSGSAGRE